MATNHTLRVKAVGGKGTVNFREEVKKFIAEESSNQLDQKVWSLVGH
ncbi:MAG TPA: hypothetical protein VGD78_09130 [Chthoniobacterales bacterium]